MVSTSRVKIRTCRQLSTSLSRIKRSTRSRKRSNVPSRTSEIPKIALGAKGDRTPFELHVDNFEAAASILEAKGVRVQRDDANAGTIWDPFGNVLRLHDHRE